MQRIENIPIEKPRQSAWPEEHGLRQICDAGSGIYPPLDPLCDKEFFLPFKQYCFGVQSLAIGQAELPDCKISDCFKNLLRFSADGNFAVINKTTFMLNGLYRLSFIHPDPLDVSGMCFFEGIFCGGIKVNQFDFG